MGKVPGAREDPRELTWRVIEARGGLGRGARRKPRTALPVQISALIRETLEALENVGSGPSASKTLNEARQGLGLARTAAKRDFPSHG